MTAATRAALQNPTVRNYLADTDSIQLVNLTDLKTAVRFLKAAVVSPKLVAAICQHLKSKWTDCKLKMKLPPKKTATDTKL